MPAKGKKALVPMRTGAEEDFLGKWHNIYSRFSAGYRKWLKRGFNKRVRQDWKRDVRSS